MEEQRSNNLQIRKPKTFLLPDWFEFNFHVRVFIYSSSFYQSKTKLNKAGSKSTKQQT